MKKLLVLLLTLPLLGACAPSAEKFFAGGRRSQLSAVHREATASEKNMLKLYRVPARFPEATLEHKLAWQRAIVAWWWAPDKQDLMTRSVALLKPEESTAFFAWLRIRNEAHNRDTLRTLNEIEAAFTAPQTGK
jgi:hypothetical protein